MQNRSVIIIGGGLAGLAAALHLSKSGKDVTLVEKQEFPKHKVCGEYLSNEVVPYLEWLGIDLSRLKPETIQYAAFSTVGGKEIRCSLPLGGIGVSRYALDNFLYKKAIENGCRTIQDSVTQVEFENDSFEVALASGEILKADIVLGAFGKRSNIDQKLGRKFAQKKSPWLAVKMHYAGEFPDGLVGLHNFDGGYCGVSKVESGIVNVCYLADFDSFKKYKNIEQYERAVVCGNPHLRKLFDNFVPLLEQPVTISQISFEKKAPVEHHILMIGDSAGLIHPLCGNGMAMAIHSAKLASECAIDYLENRIDRNKMEQDYRLAWDTNFRKRLKTGRMLASALRRKAVSELLLSALAFFPALLPKIIKMTHGKPLKIAA